MNTQPVKHFVKLLSVSLFQVMEESENVLHQITTDKAPAQRTLLAQTLQIQKWLALLPVIDQNLPKDIFIALEKKSKTITSSNVETMLNATALTLMLLDDHYRIFSLEMPKPASTLIPIMQLQDIKPNMSISKPTLV